MKFGDLSAAWTEEAVERLVAVSDHVVGVGTVRNMDVPVHVSVSDSLPALKEGEWDRINSASIECDTGRLVLAGCTDYFPDAARLPVPPGRYDILIAYKGVDTISEDGLDGNDSYHIFIAPSI
jgi:hypothetical protein